MILTVHFMLMDTLVVYYIYQEGHSGGGGQTHYSIGPIYAASPFLQRGYGIGSFLAALWRSVAKTLGRETLRTGCDILTDIARSTDEENPRDIISRRLNETAH